MAASQEADTVTSLMSRGFQLMGDVTNRGSEQMESTLTTSTQGNSWEIVPTNTIAGTVLGVLFIYLFFRHLMFVLMFMDLILGWLRKFNWFPKEGKRRKTFIHWVIAMALFLGFLSVAGSAGWLEFIPQ